MIRTLLHQLRRRLLLQLFLNAFAGAALACSGVLLGIVAVLHPMPWPVLGLLVMDTLFVALGFGAARVWVKYPSLEQVAREIDRRAGTQDRLSTALAFGSSEQPAGSMQSAALAECQSYLATFDAVRWTPLVLPKALPWLAAPLLSIILLRLSVDFAFAPIPAAPVRPPNPATLKTAARLEEMANRLELRKKEEWKPDLQKLAEALKRSASKLRAEAQGEAPAKAALRELSAMEELLQSAQQRQALESLGEALAQAGLAEEAAQELKNQNAPKAAEKLEELGKRLTEGKRKEAQLKLLEKALANAAQSLGAKSELGSAAAKGAAAGKQNDPAGMGQAISQMGKSLRNQGKSGAGGGSGDAKSMQGMISQLQEMKSGSEGESAGQQPTPPPPQSSNAGAQGQAVAGSSERMKPTGDPKNGMTSSEGGQAGSDHDIGSRETITGKASTPPGQAGLQVQLEGMLGRGESLRSMVPGTSGPETAKKEYRALYDATAPAAEDALAQENIPIGSRLYIKRYFEAIRPK
ncbi:MAG: hypothetical protein WCP06_13650 [Verrucomicrobiota bacterium]